MEEYDDSQLFENLIQNNDIIFAKYKPLVYHIVTNYYSTILESEKADLVSEGFVGLQKAIKSYNPNKNTKFKTYCFVCITNEINMYLRKYNKCYRQTGNNVSSLSSNIKSLNQDCQCVEIESIFAVDPTNYEEMIVESIMKQYIIDVLMKRLSNQERTLIELYYIKGKTQKQISAELQITQSAVSRKITKAINKLKKSKEIRE